MGLFAKVRSAVGGALLGFRSMFGQYQEATSFGPDRGAIHFFLGADSRNYITSWTRREILRRVEWLFQNFGIVKEAVRGIARITVQRGICLTLETDDEEWNGLAEADVECWAMSPDRCDLAGRRNLYEQQTHAVEMRLKKNDVFVRFAPNPRWDGEPCLQHFDPDEIETPADAADDPFWIDGVHLNQDHCAIEYGVRKLGGGHARVPAYEMARWFHADATNQVRGTSEFAQAVAPLCHTKDLIKLTTSTAKQNAAIGLHIKKAVKVGGRGGLDKIRTLKQRQNVANGGEPGENTTDPSGDKDTAFERVSAGAGIIYTDADGDAKFITPTSPNPQMETFITKVLVRDGLSSVGCPSELLWDCSNLNSANQRFILERGEVLFSTLGDGLEGRILNPAATRYLLHRITTGKLRRPMRRVLKMPTLVPGQAYTAEQTEPVETWVEDTENHWMSCLHWQRPKKLSIDEGRIAAAEISQLENNVETLSTIHDRRGRGWRRMIDQWFRECAYAARSAKRQGAEWALVLWRRGMPGAQGAAPDPEDTGDRLSQLEEKQSTPTPAEK